MKSWRSRIGCGLAVGAAAVVLTATSAAADPSGDGWTIAGADRYASLQNCLDEELPAAEAIGYNQVYCEGPDGNGLYRVWYRSA